MNDEILVHSRPKASWPERAVTALVLGFLVIAPIQAGPKKSDGDRDKPYWRTNLFKRVALDQKFLVTHWWPSEFKDPTFVAPLGVSFGIAASSGGSSPGFDDRAELYVGNWIRGQAEGPATALSRVGDSDSALVLVGGVYLISRLSGNRRLSETSSLTAEALVNAALWNTALKRATSRNRPDSTATGRLFDGRGHSFPSGHAMGAFAAAAVVSGQHRRRKWVPWVAYGTASLIAGSRVALGRHYFSDVAAGAVLGRSIGKMVVARARGASSERPATWSPIVDPVTGSYGLSYSRSW